MASSKMFVPDKIKVGYQERRDTYTGKLAYVIYYDEKGKLRKEGSWEGWRDERIAAQDFENVPTEGFVLNRKAGGQRWSWNSRNTYVRVWDPRDFEFEISIPNLLFILQECTATKGKGLEGEFVYAWNGSELVLLPVESQEYKACKDHTDRQSKKIVAKDVKPGFTYLMKNGMNVLYLGRYQYNDSQPTWRSDHSFKPVGYRHIFLNLDDKRSYLAESGFTRLAEVSSEAGPEFPDALDKFLGSKYYGEVKEVSTEKSSLPSNLSHYYSRNVLVKEGDVFQVLEVWAPYDYGSYYYNNQPYLVKKSKTFTPKAGSLKWPLPSGDKVRLTRAQFEALDFRSMFVVTSKGKKVQVM